MENESTKPSAYEDLQAHVRDLSLPRLETWTNQYPDRDFTIHLDIPEFTCICPRTGLPDFATIVIDYVPDRLCVELRSLKLYIAAYRSVGIFHEHVVNRILDDLVQAVRPRRIDVNGVFGTRGGIQTTVSATWPQAAAPATRGGGGADQRLR
jgi:7-cyano-7-deazaguanine reductase